MTTELEQFGPFLKRERSWEGQGPLGPVLVKWGDYDSSPRPGLPTVLATGATPRFLVRQLHPGPSLQEMAPLDLEQALELFSSVLSVLQRLHQDGVVHGRLKPSNIFRAGLTDSGLLVPETDPLALLFRAPELSGTSTAPIGPGADLYSAGAVLYFMLVGKPPFAAANLSQALRAPFVQLIPSLSQTSQDPDLRFGLEMLLTRLMSIDPRDRYLSASQVLAELDLLRQSPSTFVVGIDEQRDRLALPAFTGRRELLPLLKQLLQQGGVVQLVGEAGSGKSSLAEMARRSACAQGWLVLHGRSRQHAADTPLQLLDELCQDLLSQGDPRELERILGELGGWRSVVCSALPALGPSGDQGPESYAWIRTQRALSLFLQVLGTCERPALIVLEDLHWSPPDVLEIVAAVKLSSQLAILVTSRRELSLSGPCLHVPGLSLSEAERMARSMLGRCQPSIPKEAAQGSRGNPYILASLLHGWCQDGFIKPSEGGWIASQGVLPAPSLGDPPLPGQLDPATRDVLSLAAVVGREFEPELLSELVEASLVKQALEQGADLGLVQRSGLQTWSFSHDLTREAIFNWQPSARRQQHLRVAQALVRRHPQPDAEIAHHFHLAGEKALALPFARRAAEAARLRHAWSAAQTYLQFALAGAPSEAALWEELGEVQRIAGLFAEADQSYTKAFSLFSQRLDLARVLGGQAEAAFGAGELDVARTRFGQALSLLGHPLPSGRWSKNWALLRELLALMKPGQGSRELSEAERLALKLLNLVAYVLAYSDGYGLIWANLRCLNLTRKAKPGREMGIALITHAVAVLYLPALLSRSRRSASQALELLERFGSEHDRASAMVRAATIALFTGRPSEAVDMYHWAVPILQRSGDRYDAHLGAYGFGLALYALGRLDQARSLLKENLNECLAIGDSLGAANTLRVLGLLEPIPEELIAKVPENPDFPSVTTLMAEVRGLHHLQRGEFSLALVQLEGGCRLARASGDVLEDLWLGCFLLRARRLLAQQEAGAHRLGLEALAEKDGRRCLGLARKGYLLFVPRLCRELALLKVQQGQFEGASDLLKQALSQARSSAMRYEEALSLWEGAELARLSPGSGGQEMRDEAGRLFGQTGSSWECTSSMSQQPGVALADRFDQVVLWTQAIAAKRSVAEVVETARQAAEALLRCRAVRFPIHHSGNEVCKVLPPDSAGHSALTIPLPWAGESGLELHCTSNGREGFFGDEELRLAQLIQGQAKVALTNAHLLAEVQEHESQLEQLFSSVPAGIAVIDGGGTVLKTNPRLVKMLGRDPMGSQLIELLEADDRPWFAEALGRLGQASALQRELRLELPEGRLLWGELSLQRLPGLEGRTIVTLSDVSQRRLEQIAVFQERERSMLSAEVHDVLSQPLVGLHMGLEALSLQHPEAQTALRSAAQNARDVLDDARVLIARLRSPQLTSLCLSQSIEEAVEELIDGQRTEVGLELDSALNSLPQLSTLFAYRIVVEALTNCQRHSRASRLRVRLRLIRDELQGIIADDGQGFTPQLVSPGRFGLRIVGERAELLGGHARVRSAPGGGTAVFFRLPVLDV